MHLGAEGGFVAFVVAQFAIAGASVVLFRRGKWKRVRV
jgi:hypothetical protein